MIGFFRKVLLVQTPDALALDLQIFFTPTVFLGPTSTFFRMTIPHTPISCIFFLQTATFPLLVAQSLPATIFPEPSPPPGLVRTFLHNTLHAHALTFRSGFKIHAAG
jgi:hypothetical protein